MKKIFFFLFLLSINLSAYCQHDSLLAVRKGNKWGFINYAGKTVVPFKYQNVGTTFYDGVAIVKEKGKWGMINKAGKYIIKPQLDSIVEFMGFDRPLIIAKGKKKGAYFRGKQIAKSIYDDIHAGDNFIIVQQKGKWGYIDSTGKQITKIKYDDYSYFSEDLASVGINEKYGYINKQGKEVIPLKYSWAFSFYEGCAVVRTGRSWNSDYMYINKNGDSLFNKTFDDASSFSEGLARVSGNIDGYYIDKKGDTAFIVKDNGYYGSFSGGFASFSPSGSMYWGLINRQGKVIVPPKFIDIVSYWKGDYLIDVKSVDSLIGFYDTLGVERVAPKYNKWGYFFEGMAAVQLNNHWGFIDSLGNEVIAPKYENKESYPSFGEGFAAVRLNGKYGFIDKKGLVVIPFAYDSVGGFNNGLAPVQRKGKWGFINRAGEVKIPLVYNNYNPCVGILEPVMASPTTESAVSPNYIDVPPDDIKISAPAEIYAPSAGIKVEEQRE